ncbi:MAG TPA: UDP-N-acetylglucosamine 1-carboxyvinyltransferase [Cyanobacteria bacterium UBA8530]|nr:UDP-N-acetylglucosamine 1-carboxyvinyltransferase [Cyanobacteria bacterium UBA8530]
MDKLVIAGGKPLEGSVPISGAKNSALAILAGSLLSTGECLISNVPNLLDVQVICEVLASLGVRLMATPDGMVRVDASTLREHTTPYHLVTRMRASFFVLGPILARLGQARIPLPGGCAIGSRPVDLHLKGLRSLGARVNIGHGFVEAFADKLVGGNVYLDYPSVGATETIMMAATLAEGRTVIENCAQEPEIADLADFLIKMGASIRGAGTETITIEGTTSLHRCDHRVIPDRIEAGTFMVAAAITKGKLRLQNVRLDHLQAVIAKLVECGMEIVPEGQDLLVSAPNTLKSIDLRTLPFPGFPTDLQAPLMTLLATINGTSVVAETVFENRFLHVDELLRMGANIKTEGNCAIIQGVPVLTGAPVQATDLRAGAAMVLAGLAAKGETVVSDIHHIDRGYERLEEKLTNVGASIKRIPTTDSVLV